TTRAEVAHAGKRFVFAALWRGILTVAIAVFQGVLYEFIATGSSTCRIWRGTRCPGHATLPGTPQARRGLSAPRAAQPHAATDGARQRGLAPPGRPKPGRLEWKGTASG